MREEGLGGFFKGMESKILQTALNAVSMMPADVPGLKWGGGVRVGVGGWVARCGPATVCWDDCSM